MGDSIISDGLKKVEEAANEILGAAAQKEIVLKAYQKSILVTVGMAKILNRPIHKDIDDAVAANPKLGPLVQAPGIPGPVQKDQEGDEYGAPEDGGDEIASLYDFDILKDD